MSRTLSMNCGSGESLNASVWCGLSANARQIRLTADWLIPVAAAIDRVDQCVALAGCSSSVFTITRSTCSSLIVQTVDPAPSKPAPPLTHRVVVTAQIGRDLAARPSLRGRQHDPTAKRQRLRARRSPSPPLQHLPLLIAEHNLRTNGHNRPQSSPMTKTTSRPTTRTL